MKTYLTDPNGMVNVAPAQAGRVRDWQRWAPYAAVAWSLFYAALGISWALSGRGFPYAPETLSGGLAPLAGQFGPSLAWIIVVLAGIPAAGLGIAMLRQRNGKRSGVLRLLLITAGVLLAGMLLLLMTDINLLILLGYIPYAVRSLFTNPDFSQWYLQGWMQWTTIHQLLCLAGGFLWLAATVCYARKSGAACLYCGRRDGPEGWQSPKQAARWGRVAVGVAMVAPVLYSFTRYAWALGFSLGMSEAAFRDGQARGMWISGLFLATFCLVGALIMLGLVQRWGEVFPRWMIGLAGRRVPAALAVVPASLVSVLLIVGGISMWTSMNRMVTASAAGGTAGIQLIWEMIILVGPVLLFPVWGAALAVATLGYYFRRRGPCGVCGRGAPGAKRKTILLSLVLVLLLSACGPALSIKTAEPGTPSPIASSTHAPVAPVEPLALDTPTAEVQAPPTAAKTVLPTTASTGNPKPIFKTSIGTLAIETTRWVGEVNGVMAGPDERLLLISISKPDQPKLDPSNFSLQAFDKAMREQSQGEVHIAGDNGAYAVCSMAGWVGSQNKIFAMGFRVPKTAKTLQLFWPGNAPIDLYPEE